MIDFHRTASTSTYLVTMSIFVGDMIDSFLAYMTDFYQYQGCSLTFVCDEDDVENMFDFYLYQGCFLTFACDEDDVENMFDFYLYQACFFADIWNQETRNSRSLSRSFW